MDEGNAEVVTGIKAEERPGWERMPDDLRDGIEKTLRRNGLSEKLRVMGDYIQYPSRPDGESVRLAVAHSQLLNLVTDRAAEDAETFGLTFSAMGAQDGEGYLFVCCPHENSQGEVRPVRDKLVREANLIIAGLQGKPIPFPKVK
jgi:hypothetical protein